jgi:hypothetical protein
VTAARPKATSATPFLTLQWAMRRLVLLVMLGCGGSGPTTMSAAPDAGSPDTGSSTSVPCAARHGTYRLELTTRSGNCGAQKGVTFDADAPPTTECFQTVTNSADLCKVDVSSTCPVAGQPGLTVFTLTTATWSQSGATGEGEMMMKILSDSILVCEGTYGLAYTRI